MLKGGCLTVTGVPFGTFRRSAQKAPQAQSLHRLLDRRQHELRGRKAPLISPPSKRPCQVEAWCGSSALQVKRHGQVARDAEVEALLAPRKERDAAALAGVEPQARRVSGRPGARSSRCARSSAPSAEAPASTSRASTASRVPSSSRSSATCLAPRAAAAALALPVAGRQVGTRAGRPRSIPWHHHGPEQHQPRRPRLLEGDLDPADRIRSGQSEIASIQNDHGRTPVVVSSRNKAQTHRPIPSDARFQSTFGGAPSTVVVREQLMLLFSHESTAQGFAPFPCGPSLADGCRSPADLGGQSPRISRSVVSTSAGVFMSPAATRT